MAKMKLTHMPGQIETFKKLDSQLDKEPVSPPISEISDGAFMQVDVDLIETDPKQPREIFDPEKLEGLAESLRSNGFLQPVVIRMEEGRVILIAGERRLRAAKLAGLKKVPAIYRTGDPEELSLIENIVRENLNPIEEARACQRMITNRNYTQEKLAEVLGKKRNTITSILSLNKLPEDVQERCLRADISKRTLIDIASLKDEVLIREKVRLAIEEGFTSKEIRNKKRKKGRAATSQTSLIFRAAAKLLGDIKKIKPENIDQVELSGIEEKIKEIESALKILKNNL